jgi:hypothetical protein
MSQESKKQTAVEWLVEQIIKYGLVPQGTNPNNILFQQAKEMEKEQIMDAHRKGQEDEKDYWNIGDKSMTRHTGNSMEYYTKTYGKQQNG